MQHALPLRGQLRFDLMQKQRDLIQQPFRRARVLDDDRAGEAPERVLFIARERLTGIDDDRREGHIVLLGHLLEQIVTAQIRQIQVEHHAIEGGCLQLHQGFGGCRYGVDPDFAIGQQLRETFALSLVVFDDQHIAQVL